MRWLGRCLCALLVVWCGTVSAAVTFSPDNPDLEAFEKYIQDLRSRTLNKKLAYLSLAGDVRVTWRAQRGERRGKASFGVAGTPSRQRWISDVNILIDVGRLPGWCSIKVNFNNPMGELSGSDKGLSLQRGLIGYNFVYENPCREVYIQGGREMLFDDFDSRIEFNDIFDGFLFCWTEKVKDWGNYYAKGGPMIIDFKNSHYGWVVETGLEDFAGSGAYGKISLIDWAHHYKHSFRENRTNFVIAQYQLGYWWDLAWCKAPLELYAAYLQNYAARGLKITLHRKEDKAFYLGFAFGKLERAGDWVIDFNYQWVQALAIPQFDVSGIGLGVPGGEADRRFFEAHRASRAQGNTNYKGFAFKGSMNFTRNLVGQLKWEWSVPIIHQIGGRGFYQKTQLQALFAF
jgi:hypothetical protein